MPSQRVGPRDLHPFGGLSVQIYRQLASKRQKTCGKCRYFNRYYDPEQGKYTLMGYCHRFPPMLADLRSEDLLIHTRPLVKRTEWCGEWAEIEQEEAETPVEDTGMVL